MRFITGSFLTCLIPTVSALLIGEWQQVYSDNFVQTTTEIDWYCVNVSVEVKPFSILTVTKNAFLHGGDTEYESLPDVMTLEDGLVTIGGRAFIDRYGDSNPNTTVLTGLDNLSLFVWTRNSSAFYNSQEEKQILHDLTALWNFTGPYKTPVAVPCNR